MEDVTNNIDKDIKELEWSQSQMRLGNLPSYSQAHYKAIENVLSELETKDKIIDVMAELMAHKIGTRTHICQNMKCDKKIAKECKSCVIEWAENEVLKDDNENNKKSN